MSDSRLRPGNFAALREDTLLVHMLIHYLREAELGTYCPYEADEMPRQINRLNELYKGLLQDLEKISCLTDEGIFEITLRTRSKTMTYPLLDAQKATRIGDEVRAEIQDKLDSVFKRIEWARGEHSKDLIDASYQENIAHRLLYQEMLTSPIAHYEAPDAKNALDTLMARSSETRKEHDERFQQELAAIRRREQGQPPVSSSRPLPQQPSPSRKSQRSAKSRKGRKRR